MGDFCLTSFIFGLRISANFYGLIDLLYGCTGPKTSRVFLLKPCRLKPFAFLGSGDFAAVCLLFLNICRDSGMTMASFYPFLAASFCFFNSSTLSFSMLRMSCFILRTGSSAFFRTGDFSTILDGDSRVLNFEFKLLLSRLALMFHWALALRPPMMNYSKSGWWAKLLSLRVLLSLRIRNVDDRSGMGPIGEPLSVCNTLPVAPGSSMGCRAPENEPLLIDCRLIWPFISCMASLGSCYAIPALSGTPSRWSNVKLLKDSFTILADITLAFTFDAFEKLALCFESCLRTIRRSYSGTSASSFCHLAILFDSAGALFDIGLNLCFRGIIYCLFAKINFIWW